MSGCHEHAGKLVSCIGDRRWLPRVGLQEQGFKPSSAAVHNKYGGKQQRKRRKKRELLDDGGIRGGVRDPRRRTYGQDMTCRSTKFKNYMDEAHSSVSMS